MGMRETRLPLDFTLQIQEGNKQIDDVFFSRWQGVLSINPPAQFGFFRNCLSSKNILLPVMEVSRRRIIQKHLQPARPLRRCSTDQEPCISSAETFACGPAEQSTINSIGVEQFFKILHLQTQTPQKDSTQPNVRISYSRDFLIQLASCPIARKKPDFLPEHPVVLERAREPGVPKSEKRCDEMR
ncbi:uncharacterized protein C8orf88 isoform X2 [Esox lucius]|uniref:uncharacterized protein C8orf88 isoform X2 n=1 Tax=Esox lucius TaxID=8010 RepID=UPI00097349FF|nr:uncharacterized protein C8orf88 isoform X2 [Esox lucius]